MTFPWRQSVQLALGFMGEPSSVFYMFQISNLNSIINLFAVKWYGESEFRLSSGKLLLILMLFCFTFITMVGGNLKHDAYGFRYWREPVPTPYQCL